MKKFPFLISPNALPVADFQQFIHVVSQTSVKNICVREKWQPFTGIEKTSLQICVINTTGNFAEKVMQEKLLDVMCVAQQFNIPLVNIACRRDLSKADQNSSIDFFKDAAACAKEKSLGFTLETYGVISRTAEECLRVLERVGDDTLQICYDTANVWRFAPELKNSDDLLRDFCKLQGAIGFMHLKDFDPEMQQIMTLGKGKIDFLSFFGILENWQYDGFIGLDLETAQACRINSLTAHEKELHRSLDYLSFLGVIGE